MMRAPERIAAKRAAQKRVETRRRFLVPIAAVTAVLAITGVLVAVKLSSGPASLRPPASR
jgi:putative copper export protein